MTGSTRRHSRKLYREYRSRKSAAEASQARQRMLESKLLEFREKAAEWDAIAVDAHRIGKNAIEMDAVEKRDGLQPGIEDYARRVELQREQSEMLEQQAEEIRMRISGLSGLHSLDAAELDFDRRLYNSTDAEEK